MNALHLPLHPALESRALSPKRSVAGSEKRSLAILYCVTASGLLSILAAMCATMRNAELKAQREHLAHHLDRVLEDLGVGLGDPAEGSPHNRPNGKTRWTEGRRQPSAG